MASRPLACDHGVPAAPSRWLINIHSIQERHNMRPTIALLLTIGIVQQFASSSNAAEPQLVAAVKKEAREKPNPAPEFYDPVERKLEGWTVVVDPKLLSDEHRDTREKALKALANHLQRVTYIVPQDRLAELKKLRIWVELHNNELGAMQYHPSRGWLKAHGHDPRLEKHVHIPRAKALFDRHMWAKHPYVVLHELAHSYHDQVLSFDQPAIIEAFDSARKDGIYEDVLLYTGRKVRHYGLNNHKEYFAESTEAYFGVNDFYPFVRAELREHDPKMFSLLEKIWGPVR